MNTLKLAVWAADAFPAKAGPTGPRHRQFPLHARDAFSGTGFSREEAGMNTLKLAVWLPTPSRLKPVPQFCATARSR